MTGDQINVTATAGGFLVRTATGRGTAASDLGAVWEAVHGRTDVGSTQHLPVGLVGPATVPVAQAIPTRVVLALEAPGRPTDVSIDAWGSSPEDLLAQLVALTSGVRPTLISVRVRTADVHRLLPKLRAHPRRPFAVSALQEETRIDHPQRVQLPTRGSYRDRLPALMAWLAARDGTGSPEELQLRLPLGNNANVELHLVYGIVTWCVLTETEALADHVPLATLGPRDAAWEPVVTALLGSGSAVSDPVA